MHQATFRTWRSCSSRCTCIRPILVSGNIVVGDMQLRPSDWKVKYCVDWWGYQRARLEIGHAQTICHFRNEQTVLVHIHAHTKGENSNVVSAQYVIISNCFVCHCMLSNRPRCIQSSCVQHYRTFARLNSPILCDSANVWLKGVKLQNWKEIHTTTETFLNRQMSSKLKINILSQITEDLLNKSPTEINRWTTTGLINFG